MRRSHRTILSVIRQRQRQRHAFAAPRSVLFRASVPSAASIARLPTSFTAHQRHFASPPAAARPPDPPLPTSAAEAAERGLRILRQRRDKLGQDDAMEAWRCLLHAACEEVVSTDVYYALGYLHHVWGNLLESGKRIELGAEGAARAVVEEIKDLRREAIRKRQSLPASGGRRRNHGNGDVSRGQGPHSDSEEIETPDTKHSEAWVWYLKAANHGDSRAMMQLGDLALEVAPKSAANAKLAEQWYRKAAKGDPPQPDALFQIARIWHEGIGVAIDLGLAREKYEEANREGSAAAAFFLGHRFHVGDDDLNIRADGQHALKLLQLASRQQHAEAIFYLAQAYRSGCSILDLPQSIRDFREMVQQAAEAGSADAKFAIGDAHFHGEDGFAKDPQAAFRYYSAAAEMGHADASYCLGVMHYAVGGMQEAFRCYQTAAEGGNMLAWQSIASMYALGEGVPRSEQMAHSILATFGDRIRQHETHRDGGGERSA